VASLDSLQAQSWQDATVNADAAIGAVISELVSKGAITSQALQRGRRAADESQERLDHVLNKLGLVSDDDLTEAWSVTTGLSVVEPDAYPERAILEKDLNADFLKNAGAIPLELKDGTLLLAVTDAANSFIPAAVEIKTGLNVVCKLADDRRVVSGIVYVIRNGLQWKDAPKEYGPHKTLYNRFKRWSRLGVFDRIFVALASEGPKPERIMLDATHLKAHRTAASLLKKGMFPVVSGARKVA
jgi:transposase